jgi:hypothetical protein
MFPDVSVNGYGLINSFKASKAQGPEIRMTANAVAPEPIEAPPPPDERANIVSCVSDAKDKEVVNRALFDFDGGNVVICLVDDFNTSLPPFRHGANAILFSP